MKDSTSLVKAALLVALLSAFVPAIARAQEPEPKPNQTDGNRDPNRRGRGNRDWLQRIGLVRAPGEFERSHEKVTSAFRAIVTAPSQATVKVLVDENQVALGAIVDADGYILTKASELKGKPAVQLADDRKYHARVVGVESNYDLAMLKIGAEGLPVVDWAESEPPVGSFLAAPSLDPAHAAFGVVSVVPRRIGAPSPMLGVQLEEDSKGPRVNQVLPGTGAEKAGLQVNDIVTHVNGEAVKSREALIEAIRKNRSGDTVLLTVKRGDVDLALAATLSVITPTDPDRRREFQNNLGGTLSTRRDGFPLALQHDVVLRPADCGGPLVDLDGKAVGLNIARGGRVNSYAIPTSAIKPLLPELKSGNLAPEMVAKKKLETLLLTLTQLKSSESELAKKAASAEKEFKTAYDAEAEAKKATEPDMALLEKLHSATFAAEKALKLLKAELSKAQAELKRNEAEKLVLEKSLAKE